MATKWGEASEIGIETLGLDAVTSSIVEVSLSAQQDRHLASHGPTGPNTEMGKRPLTQQAEPNPRSTPQPQCPPSKAGEARFLTSPQPQAGVLHRCTRRGSGDPSSQDGGCMGFFSVLNRVVVVVVVLVSFLLLMLPLSLFSEAI